MISGFASGQFVFRGHVVNDIRQKSVTAGEVREGWPSRSGRRQKLPPLVKIDSLGNFQLTLNKPEARICVSADGGGECLLVRNTDTVTTFHIRFNCGEFDEKGAQKDITSGDIKLLCILGYGANRFDSVDRAFAKRYGLSYYTFADMPIPNECMWSYNQAIAKYLDEQFGTIWRTEVRRDVPLN
jgi:hypothetical protein